MSQTVNKRWIASILAEGAAGIPVLPWERAAKRARRLQVLNHHVAFGCV